MDEKTKTPLQLWTEQVEQSRGILAFLPDQFKEEAAEIERGRKEFNELLNTEIAEKEIDLQVATQTLFHKVRKYWKEAGKKNIFSRDIGWNKDALNEGIYVINVIDPPQR